MFVHYNIGNFPRGGPFVADWPGNGKHYPVAILQADGLYELEQGINGGQSADLWNQPTQVLGPGNGEKIANTADYPNTDSYAFGDIITTGLTIRNFQMKPGGEKIMTPVTGMTHPTVTLRSGLRTTNKTTRRRQPRWVRPTSHPLLSSSPPACILSVYSVL